MSIFNHYTYIRGFNAVAVCIYVSTGRRRIAYLILYTILLHMDKRKKMHEKMYINNCAAYASVSLTLLPACALQFMKIKYMHKMDDDITNKKCINIDLPNNERVDFDLFLLCRMICKLLESMLRALKEPFNGCILEKS